MVAGVGWKPGYVGHARAGADLNSPAGYAFQTGEPLISSHLENETRFRTPKILADHHVKRAINVLIRVGRGMNRPRAAPITAPERSHHSDGVGHGLIDRMH